MISIMFPALLGRTTMETFLVIVKFKGVLLQLLYFPSRNSTTLRYCPPPFFVFAPKQLDTICSPHASYAVAVGSTIGRRSGSHSGVAPGDLRDRAGCQASLSTPISGGLS